MSRVTFMFRSCVVAALLFGFAGSGLAAIKHVLLISVDGLRGDFLRTMVETAPSEVPTFTWLRDRGAVTFNARCCATWGVTNGNHVSMITSRPVLQPPGFPNTVHHGYTDNGFISGKNIQNFGNPAVPYKASIFDMVHDRGLTTGAYFQKQKLQLIIDSYDATYGSVDTLGVNHGRNKIDDAPTPNEQSKVPELLAAIQSGQFKNFSMLHIAYPDYAGHGSGWTVAAGTPYRNAVRNSDAEIGSLLSAILAKPAYAQSTAIIIVADHGGGESNFFSHGDVTKLGDVTIPFYFWAPGVAGGVDAYTLFENRFEPGTTIPSYLAANQPLRNVDSGNLAAALLGLPPIPGSMVRPVLRRPVTLTQVGKYVQVRWPIYLTGETLEYSTNVDHGDWEPIRWGIQPAGEVWLHEQSIFPQRFFRLRSPQ